MCDMDDESTLTKSGVHRARHDRKCSACHETIRRGDQYHKTKQLHDGSWDSWDHCLRCHAICEALWKAGAEYVQFDLDCEITWEEEFGPMPDSVARLAFMTADEAQAELRSP